MRPLTSAPLDDRIPALLGTLLVATSWTFLFHGVYGRMYSLFLFTSALSYLALLHALDRGDRLRTGQAAVPVVLPGGVVVEVNGRRFVAAELKRTRRPDVMRHLGLSTDECGFSAIVEVPGAARVEDLGRDTLVFGGDSPEHAHAPLRIAPKLAAILAANTPTHA